MANTNQPGNGRSFEDPEDPKSSGKPFDIEQVTKDGAEESTNTFEEAPDGYVHPWNPIPPLKQLLRRIIPPRW